MTKKCPANICGKQLEDGMQYIYTVYLNSFLNQHCVPKRNYHFVVSERLKETEINEKGHSLIAL